MAYTAVSKVSVGQLFTEPMYEIIRENFNQGIPGLYSAKGQIVAATGSRAESILAAPSNGKSLVVNTSNANKLEWLGGIVPLGFIIIWSGSQASIPSGWQLCDGSNGTPDLRGKFVVGAGSTYAVNATGGGVNLAHTHTPTQAATDAATFSHTHTQSATGSESSHTHVVSLTTGVPSSTLVTVTGGFSHASGTHTHTITAVNAGTSHTHTNPTSDSGGASHTHTSSTTDSQLTTYLPPYYALCFIQRVS